jgi:hypothetical protein
VISGKNSKIIKKGCFLYCTTERVRERERREERKSERERKREDTGAILNVRVYIQYEKTSEKNKIEETID